MKKKGGKARLFTDFGGEGIIFLPEVCKMSVSWKQAGPPRNHPADLFQSHFIAE